MIFLLCMHENFVRCLGAELLYMQASQNRSSSLSAHQYLSAPRAFFSRFSNAVNKTSFSHFTHSKNGFYVFAYIGIYPKKLLCVETPFPPFPDILLYKSPKMPLSSPYNPTNTTLNRIQPHKYKMWQTLLERERK